MFCSRQINNINNLNERALRILLNDQTSNLETLLLESSDICNNHRNIQTLMTETYKIPNNISPPTMETMLEKKHSIQFQESKERQRNAK